MSDSDEETKAAPYNWKRKPVWRPQNKWLEKVVAGDTVMRVWDMLPLVDMFALTFVSQQVREHVIDRAKKTRYVTSRARKILLDILCDGLRGRAGEFLELMRDHNLYIGGSSILHGIMYGTSDHCRWSSTDIDAYVNSDAAFGLMKPTLDAMFKSVGNFDDHGYAGWYYGKWEDKLSGHRIDIISTFSGIENYDLTICQNSIDWEGRMRALRIYDIVHKKIHITRRFEYHFRQFVSQTDDVMDLHSNSRKNQLAFSKLECRTHVLAKRINKYISRGFTFDGDIHAYFKDSLDGKFLPKFVRYIYSLPSILDPRESVNVPEEISLDECPDPPSDAIGDASISDDLGCTDHEH